MTDTIQDLWAEVVDVGCKGLCEDSCGPIGASPVELRMLAWRGVVPGDPMEALEAYLDGGPVESCPALVDGRCSVYEIRPLVCRLWGSVEEMPCPHGCVPAGGHMPWGAGGDLLRRAMALQ